MSSLIDNFVQFHDIRMPQIRQGVYFSVDSLLCLLFLEVLLVISLDGDYVLSVLVLGSSHDGKSTGSNLQVDLEIFKVERLLIWILLSFLIDNFSELLQP